MKDLGEIEARGRDPLNSCEDARDGLEQFGEDVLALVCEVRRLQRRLEEAEAVAVAWECRALRAEDDCVEAQERVVVVEMELSAVLRAAREGALVVEG